MKNNCNNFSKYGVIIAIRLGVIKNNYFLLPLLAEWKLESLRL